MTPLIGFAPDLEQTTPGAILDGDGFIPTTRGIEAVNSWRLLTQAFDPATYGRAIASYYSSSDGLYVATTTHVLHIYLDVFGNHTTTDITPSGYTAGDNPKFYKYGNYVFLSGLLATYYHTNALTQMTTLGVAQREPGFARGFYHLRWYLFEWFASDEGDPTAFTIGPASNAASGTFPDTEGVIVDGSALGEFAVLYKRQSVWVGQFANSTVKWAWQRVPTIDGCAYNGSLIALRDAHYYFAEHNIFRFDGGRPLPIGEPVRNWLSKWVGLGYTRIRAVHAPVNDSIVWYLGAPASTGDEEARYVRTLEYHIASGRYGTQQVAIDCPVLTDGPVYFSRLPATLGPYEQLYMIRDGALYARDGIPSSATLLLNQYGDDDRDTRSGRVLVSYSRRPSAATLRHDIREHLDGDIQNTQTNDNPNGHHDIRLSGRWHQNSLQLSGSWTIRGVRQVPERIEGRR